MNNNNNNSSKGGGGGGVMVVEDKESPPITPTLLLPPTLILPQPPSSPSTPRSKVQSKERGTTATTTTIPTTTTTSNITITLTPPATTTTATTTKNQTARPLLTAPTTTKTTRHNPPTTTTTTTTTKTTKHHNPTTATTTTIPRSPPTTHRGAPTTTTTTHLSPYHNHHNHHNHKKQNSGDSRLVVIGCPGVGKSALVVRLLTGRFIWEYDPTLEAAYRYQTQVDDEPAVIEVLDTAGQVSDGEGGVVSEGAARWGEGFLLVFSITDRESFTSITDLHATLAAFRATPHFPCVMVANKTDLGHLAEVKDDEARELAEELGVSLFLTSASDGGPAISAAFTELHREVVRRRWSRRRRSSAKTVIEGFYKMFSR